jgi:hypothetical protein
MGSRARPEYLADSMVIARLPEDGVKPNRATISSVLRSLRRLFRRDMRSARGKVGRRGRKKRNAR